MGDGWRYIAQRFDGNTGGLGDFLDFNVPLTGVNLEEVLSGDNALSGTITPEYTRLKGADGQPILREWGTAIWAEDPDGEIRGGGLLTYSDFTGPTWTLECTDLTVITDGLPFTEAAFFVNVDPMDLFRHIWEYVQRQPSSNMGISIDATTSPMRLGTDLIQRIDFDLEPDPSESLPEPGPEPDEDLPEQPAPVAPNRYANNADWRDAGVKAMKAVGWKGPVVDDALGKWLNKDTLIENGNWPKGGLTDKERTIRDRTIEKIGWPPNPPNPGFKGMAQPILVGDVVYPVTPTPNANPDSPEPVPEEQPAPEELPVYEYDAYKLNWYTNLDLSSDIAELATKTPFDWHLTHRWVGEEIHHHIRLGYPRIGRRRPDLRFVVGENIHTVPTVERDGTEYANEVLVLGSGEGSSIIMGRAFRPNDGRVRKVVTISDPSINTTADAIRSAEQELARRFNIENLREIVLMNHPHAPMGAVDLGDEILVEGDLGWIDLEVWCRVVSRSMAPDNSDSQVLTLIRSDRLT